MPALLRTGLAAEETNPGHRALHAREHHRLARPYRARSWLAPVGQIIVVENKAGAGGTIGSFEALIKREIASNLAVSLD